MPIFRGSTAHLKRGQLEDNKTRSLSKSEEEPPTTLITETALPSTASYEPSHEPKTRILFHRSPETNLPATTDKMADPIVGWLVVINGPGKGHVLSLGYGMNSLGRSQQERVCLDFGDEEISRNQHALISYDPRGRKFYVQHGGGRNLTYLGDQPLLIPQELRGGENIMLGQTTLRFVPLCGENFDWQTNS